MGLGVKFESYRRHSSDASIAAFRGTDALVPWATDFGPGQVREACARAAEKRIRFPLFWVCVHSPAVLHFVFICKRCEESSWRTMRDASVKAFVITERRV